MKKLIISILLAASLTACATNKQRSVERHIPIAYAQPGEVTQLSHNEYRVSYTKRHSENSAIGSLIRRVAEVCLHVNKPYFNQNLDKIQTEFKVQGNQQLYTASTVIACYQDPKPKPFVDARKVVHFFQSIENRQ